MSDTDQRAVWGTVMLAGAQMVEWKIEGADKPVEGTDLRGLFRAMEDKSEGRGAVVRVSFLLRC